MISDIVNLARDLFGMRETLRGVRREKRDRLADYLQRIGDCLDSAREDLRSGGNATRACAQLHNYIDLIPPTVMDAIGPERTAALREDLRRALVLRYMRVQSAEELGQLEEAAATLTALGDYLRATDDDPSARPAARRPLANEAIVTAPPGWYADPWRQSQMRYWDGQQWTGHVT